MPEPTEEQVKSQSSQVDEMLSRMSGLDTSPAVELEALGISDEEPVDAPTEQAEAAPAAVEKKEETTPEADGAPGELPGEETEGEATEEDLEALLAWEQENADGKKGDAGSESAIEELRAQIAQLESRLAAAAATQQAPPVEAPIQLAPKSWVKDDDELNELISSPEALNKLLNEVRAESVELGYQRALQASPTKLKGMIQQEVKLSVLTSQLFSNRPEFNKIRPYVAQVASEIEKEHPDWTEFQIFAALPKMGMDPTTSRPPMTQSRATPTFSPFKSSDKANLTAVLFFIRECLTLRKRLKKLPPVRKIFGMRKSTLGILTFRGSSAAF